ncbi:beta-glucosidase [Marchantia polymorpha subsp. ruderalis]|uniref:Beta-glucosidase n=2 Tax=Marchantia polymorpha TaxID=3197 RepID=A0A176WAD0_MARPO|nr:hypothetical protein AXG93_3102s1620 [Marchantia polymorpha subsp. ruderalis]PTQ39935.1 hypothetical protein MARPO_0042s0006 [Marchantia polymorpha]BBN02234.1 hypothetical protein Mp_2g13770 [Marchantia polymorpha subsp. ruderalis]|eukprot:PTQ39935.1 hypothetical protein MARPO_0042s0006 [Marchantia polymorpha]
MDINTFSSGGILLEHRQVLNNVGAQTGAPTRLDISRNSFPSDFIFGVASSAYQIEGGALEGGKGPCTWDTETSKPGRILDGSTANVACDSYHKYQADVDLIHNIGYDAYRFSIAWSRIYPEGVGERPNQEGLDYYNRLIDSLLKSGIKPFITLCHFDLPQALVDKFGGWHGSEIVPAFAAYAETCFKSFGDRVRHWITINEPTIDLAFNAGVSAAMEANEVTRYKAGHNMILAHAHAAKIYREKYQGSSDGVIGISLDIQWFEPLTDSPEDIEASETALAFRGGWFLDPFFRGEYPAAIRKTWGYSLPSFTPEESRIVKGSADFLGVNYYTAYYVTSKPCDGFSNEPAFPVTMPSSVYVGDTKNGVLIGAQTPTGLRACPDGLARLLLFLKSKYGNPLIYITENGYSEKRNPEMTLEESLQDGERTEFFRSHIRSLLEAHKNGVNVRGYFAWTLMDNFEWLWGYGFLFGICYVDFQNNQKRYLKESALWFKKFLQK